MPPVGSTNYIIVFQISDAVAASGGLVNVSWASPGVATYTGAGTFDPSTCTLSETYAATCGSSADAGNGTECGDTNSAGADLCQGGDALTASFGAAPTLSWWDAKGCVQGLNCATCDQHVALTLQKQ
jgi:hypothetical protein